MTMSRRIARFITSWTTSRERRRTIKATPANGLVRGNYYWVPVDQTQMLPREGVVASLWRAARAALWIA
jgi:hypothetical protein